MLHWALGPGEDWNRLFVTAKLPQSRLHWALGPGEDWNQGISEAFFVGG